MSQELINRIQTYLDNPLQKIETIETINHNDFRNNYMKKNKPVVMKGMMKEWEATKSWSLDYFREIGKNKEAFMSGGNNFQKDTKWEYGSFIDSINRIENADKNNEKGGN